MNWLQNNWLWALDHIVGIAAGSSLFWAPMLISRLNLRGWGFVAAMSLWIALLTAARLVSYANGVYEGIKIQQLTTAPWKLSAQRWRPDNS